MQFKLRTDLRASGKKVRSQNEEDGIIEAIFSDIPPVSRYFVEFGIGPAGGGAPNDGNGLEGNCVLLKEQGWNGLFMDGGQHLDEYDVKREFITPMNVNRLFRKYEVPENVDIISIDVDGQDFWIWMACHYRPALYIIEYNLNFDSPWEAFTISYDTTHMWDNTEYYGCSLGALIKLGLNKGYKLVCHNGVNAFFVRLDLLENAEDFDGQSYAKAVKQYPVDKRNRSWVSV